MSEDILRKVDAARRLIEDAAEEACALSGASAAWEDLREAAYALSDLREKVARVPTDMETRDEIDERWLTAEPERLSSVDRVKTVGFM